MDFATAVRTALSKYTDFSGRARRSEYWFWTLASVLAAVVALVLDGILGTAPLVYAIVALGILLPSLAVAIRRLHDTGKSGWFLLLGLIPFGGLVLLYFFVQDSHPGPNQYGDSPKGVPGAPGHYAAPTAPPV